MTSPVPDPTISLGGDICALKGNQPLVLAGDSMVWRVRSGALVVFETEVENGAPVGARRFLFRVRKGSVLLPCRDPGSRRCLVAVAVEDTFVQSVPAASFAGRLARGEKGAIALLRDWTASIADVIADGRYPSSPVHAHAGDSGTLDVKRRLTVAPGTIAWVRIKKGAGRLGDDEEIPVTDADLPLPMTQQLWITASTQLSYEFVATQDLGGAATLWRGLAGLHRLFLASLRLRASRELDEETARLGARASHAAAAMRESMDDLAAVLDPVERFETRETPLVSAAAHVGAEVGAEIRSPGRAQLPGGPADPVEAVAAASRVRFRRVRITRDWWKYDAGPLLGFLQDGESRRPVALLRRRGEYVVIDPTQRTRRKLTAETAARVAPEAYSISRPMPHDLRSLAALMRFSLKGRGPDVAHIALVGLFITLLGMVTPLVTGRLIDEAIPNADPRLVAELCLALVAAAFGSFLLGLGQAAVHVRTGVLSEFGAQSALWDRLLRLRPSFFRAYSTGDLHDRVMTVSQIAGELNGATLNALLMGVLALLNFWLLLSFDASLAFIATTVAVLFAAVTVTVGLAVRRLSVRLQALHGEFHGLVIQLISGVGKLRVAGAEQRAFQKWVARYAEKLRLVASIQRVSDAAAVFDALVGPVSTAAIFWFTAKPMFAPGADQVHGLSMGRFLAFFTAYGMFLRGVVTVSRTLVSVADTAAKEKRVQALLDAEPEVPPGAADPGRLRGAIALTNVMFRYRPDGPMTLDGVNVSAEPGEFIALVGPSGSGKSTILRLVLGFDTPEAGSIRFDGQELSGLDVLAVRRQLGVVLQNGRLNAGSIFENIAPGGAISLDQAWEAAADAGLSDDIERLPMKLQTVVSEGGSNLSGGQRQRLLIARALALRAPIVLFDEATSALDNRTQQIVSEALRRRKVTRIVVAHRLSTIHDADRIYVLDKGKVVEHGSYDELVLRGGKFSRLVARQTT